MDKSIILCGRVFTPELINHLNLELRQEPQMSKNALARILCQHLAWWSPDGRGAVASAKVALRKLSKRGLLSWPEGPRRAKAAHRLRASGQPLPAVSKVPAQVAKVQGLHLYLLSGHEDPLHPLWNDLMIQQHPCGDAPLVGAQLRYLVGSDHGWLGALGFGPAAFVLGARDQWIGWSPAARVSQLNRVIGLSRFLIRREVQCANLASKVLSLALKTVADDWLRRYAVKPLLVESFVDRSRFTGRCFAAANWMRIGQSTGRGRLGSKASTVSLKDIWVYGLAPQGRTQLQKEGPRPLSPRGLLESLAQEQWCGEELAKAQWGDERLHRRGQGILAARWEQPQASFGGSFKDWAAAKGAYSFIENRRTTLSLETLLEPHSQATQARMAAESLVLLPQDTTGLNYSGLHQTTGLGPLGEDKGQGLWLHSLLAYRADGVPLGVLQAKCWARPPEPLEADRGRNAKSIDEKESVRWVQALHCAAAAARRMPQTQLVLMADREGDLYEMHDAAQIGPSNLQTLLRAQHDRNLQCHQKLWAFMAGQPVGQTRTIDVPRRHGQRARQARVELRWSSITIEAPKVGCKKGWPPLTLWAVWAHEPNPPEGVEAIDWMLLSNQPIANAEQAWQRVQWYRSRWGIEEWHRVLKSGCGVEHREFKTAEHLERVLAFDLIVAWRILACMKLGRALPQLPARVLYTEDELAVLCATSKKSSLARQIDLGPSQQTGGASGRLPGASPGRRTGCREFGQRSAATDGHGPRLAPAQEIL